jgi:hypothetical protein
VCLEIALQHPFTRIKDDEGGSNDCEEGYGEVLERAEEVANKDEEESAGSPCQKLPDHYRGDRDIRAAANGALEALLKMGVWWWQRKSMAVLVKNELKQKADGLSKAPPNLTR